MPLKLKLGWHFILKTENENQRLMKSILIFFCFLPVWSIAQTSIQFENPVKQRLFVLTDITNEPDDQESLVRLLVYANES